MAGAMLVTRTSRAIMERLISTIKIALNGIKPIGLKDKVVLGVTLAKISPTKSGTVSIIEQAILTADHLSFIPLKII